MKKNLKTFFISSFTCSTYHGESFLFLPLLLSKNYSYFLLRVVYRPVNDSQRELNGVLSEASGIDDIFAYFWVYRIGLLSFIVLKPIFFAYFY
jgi:hypothetical protein